MTTADRGGSTDGPAPRPHAGAVLASGIVDSLTAPDEDAVLRDFVAGAVGDPDGEHARRGCLLANSAVELSATAPDVAAEARRSYTATTAVLADAVRRAQSEGDVARDADPDEVARTVLAGQLGLVVLGRIGEDPGVLATLAGALLDRLLPA